MSFSLKRLEAEFTLFTGNFRGQGNVKIVRGLAMEATVTRNGGVDIPHIELTIYNMLDEDMNTLSMLAFDPRRVERNAVALYAIDGDARSLVFYGDIVVGGAYADYSGEDKAFRVSARTGYYTLATPASSVSYRAGATVTEIMRPLAESAGFKFSTNIDIDPVLDSTCLTGDRMRQMRSLAERVGLELIVEDEEIILKAPQKMLTSYSVPYISKDTGLIGYPSFSQTGIEFDCIYNPTIKYGGAVEVQSQLPRSSGIWQVTGLRHELTSDIADGAWTTSVSTQYPYPEV